VSWREAYRDELPSGWSWTTLGEVAETQLGKMLSKKAKTGNDEQPYLRNQNVQWGRFALDDLATMEFSGAEREKFELHEGDLVVCEGGDVGRAAVWRGSARPCFYQKALHRVRPADGVLPEYLMYALWCMSELNHFRDFASGSTILHLPQEDLRVLPIPLAPSNEQARIVRELERRLSHVDVACTTIGRVGTLLAAATMSCLRSASDGSLAPCVVGEGLGAVCSAAGVKFEAVAGQTDWVAVRLGDIAKVGSGATPLRSEPRYWSEGSIAWVTSGQLIGGRVESPAELITEAALSETSVKIWPAGTLLMAMYGEGRTRGHCAELMIDATCNQACAAIDLHEPFKAVQPFVKLVLQARYEEHRTLGNGGVQENLNLGIIKDLRIVLPPLACQGRLVEEVERRISLVSAARRSARVSAQRILSVRRSLLFTVTRTPVTC
jgi:type I restriction enzyme S subunit